MTAGDPLHESGFDVVPVPPQLPDGWKAETAGGSHIAVAERLEYEVFLEAGFCAESFSGRVGEYEPWRSGSRFMVVLDDTRTVRGTVRYLIGRYEDLPVGSFPAEAPRPPDPLLEYASLAVPVGSRGTGVTEALYRAVWLEAMRRGARGVVAIGEQWLLDVLNGVFSLGFSQLGPSRWYMGGECFPMGTTITAVLSRLEHQPAFRQWVFSEIDLRDMPAEVAEAVRRAPGAPQAPAGPE